MAHARDPQERQQPTSHRQDGPTRLTLGFRTVRDLLSFLIGAAILVNEVFISPTAEIPVLAVGASLVGLPVALNLDSLGKK